MNVEYLPKRIPNTFGVDAHAQELIAITTSAQLRSLIGYTTASRLILGAGSNILLTSDFEGTVFVNQLKGISVKTSQDDTALVTCGAGENWSEFVDTMVDQGWFGLENLSLIPGSVGASPIQNIGAYGVEIRDTFVSATAINLEDGEERVFDKNQCGFDYRTSVFKESNMRNWLITKVTFKLSKNLRPQLAYSDLERQALAIAQNFQRHEITNRDVAAAVKVIRRSKLPDPAVLGNAGSFFKNPLVSAQTAQHLKTRFHKLPTYLANENSQNLVKVSAAWLIDQCGWKGYRRGDAGVHNEHALVLVNYGTASGKEIWQLAVDIIASVQAMFEIELEPEPLVL